MAVRFHLLFFFLVSAVSLRGTDFTLQDYIFRLYIAMLTHGLRRFPSHKFNKKYKVVDQNVETRSCPNRLTKEERKVLLTMAGQERDCRDIMDFWIQDSSLFFYL